MKDKMKLKNLLKKILCFGVAVLLSLGVMPAVTASAAAYPAVDMFEHVKTVNGTYAAFKGIHSPSVGDTVAYAYTDSTGTHSVSHRFINSYFEEMIFPEPVNGAKPYTYGGKTYYFNFAPIASFIRSCNENSVTCNIQFMLRWYGSSGNMYLVDPRARVSGATSLQMYALDTEGEGRRTYRAFWRALMEWCADNNCHIDQIILGNEVNVPNTWNYFGTVDINTCTQKYAISFYDMYQAVREYSTVTRCSICLDHGWNWDNGDGSSIKTKVFLDNFHARVTALNGGASVDWCLAMHIWPALLTHPSIWTNPSDTLELTSDSVNTLFVDGSNLNVMTDYIKNNFGAQHRIMMTEQGFVSDMGEQVQAASLAYTYYACLYNDMVDSFLVFEQSGDGIEAALLPLAQQVYTKIGSADQADHDWIASVCLPVIGVSSWEQIIPGFHKLATPASVTSVSSETPAATVTSASAFTAAPFGNGKMKEIFDADYYAAAYPDLAAAFGSDKDALWNHYVTNGWKEGREMNSQLNVVVYRNTYPDLNAAFGDDWDAYVDHYQTYGKAEGRISGIKGKALK